MMYTDQPLLMGKKNTPLDWTAYEDRCKKQLGYVPDLNKRLTFNELAMLGFSKAAADIDPNKKQRKREDRHDDYGWDDDN